MSLSEKLNEKVTLEERLEEVRGLSLISGLGQECSGMAVDLRAARSLCE